MKREPKVKPVRAWAITETDDDGNPLPWRDVEYCEVWRGKKPQLAYGEHLLRVEIRPAPLRRKARKAKRS